MLINLNGQLAFCYNCPPTRYSVRWVKKFYYYKILGTLLGILVGVFLLPNVAYFSNITSENVINLTNEARLKSNLKPLTANQLLTQAAYQKAEGIIKAEEFKHNLNNKKFSEWIKDTGYKYSYVGENLAIDFVTGEGVMQAWLNSPTHKKNLLSPYYSEIGVAILEDVFRGQNTTLVVQIFGAPPQNIVQPRVMGENNFSSAESTALPNALNYNTGKFLTHSATNILTNQLTLNNNSNIFPLKQIKSHNPSSNIKVNNFFTQYNTLVLFNFLIMVFSAILIFSVFYTYYFCFTHLPRSE